MLAVVAGIVNIVGLHSFEHGAVTHMTGPTSILAMSIASKKYGQALHYFSVMASFVGGAVLSGFLIQDTSLKLGRRYGVALLIESILLCGAVPFLEKSDHTGTYMALLACGLQNAMVTTYSGAVIRTTHLTGMFTDLGIFLGHMLRRATFD